jgi:hypothetical protein
MNEVWKKIKGREEFYEVSNTGKVRSLVNRYKTKGIFELKLVSSSKGYKTVDLAKPTLKKCLVHRLVAEAFLEQPEGCGIVNHIDNDPTNNHVDNLEWTTYSGNLLHAQKQGRLFEAQSKGGKSRGLDATRELFEDVSSMIGNTYGKWTVIAEGPLKRYGVANRPTLLCLCSCGAQQAVCRIGLKTGTSTMCRKCVGHTKAEEAILLIIDKYSLTTVGDWFITDTTNYTFGIITKKLKFKAICNICGNNHMIPYTSLTNNTFFKCKHNKQHKDIVSST